MKTTLKKVLTTGLLEILFLGKIFLQSIYYPYFQKKTLASFDIAEFGVGRGGSIDFLSHYANQVDGYDGFKKSIINLKILSNNNKNINGKVVNLASDFNELRKYDIIIYGFFSYMITSAELDKLVSKSKNMLKENGYIYIYDFTTKQNKTSIDTHNKNYKIYKRSLEFYLKVFNNFNLIDYRLFDNRNLSKYLLSDKISVVDKNLDSNDYNWTFSGLFKLQK